MTKALLLIDVQNDYFAGGSMELHGSFEASLKIKDLLDHFRKKSMPVIHIQHQSVLPGSTFLVPGTRGAEIHENVKPLDTEKIFKKIFPNSFRSTGLDEYLKENKISTLVIAGMMTHMCVDTTVRAAFDLGYKCILAGDGCATRELKINDRIISANSVHNSFLAALNGIFAQVLDSRLVIENLRENL
ncbi:MAG: cysteine hydrolase [Spirochaetes bacterium]|nr:cysteine hydrolase [Spirochaetota bacterium]